jgi:nicotinamidase-related amidase
VLRHVAKTQPYPWPFDGALAGPRTALLRCGWQNHWASISQRVDDVVHRLASVADTVNREGGTVIDLRHGWINSPTGRVRSGLPMVGSFGWRVYGSHGPSDHRGLTIDTAGLDGCYGSQLEHVLRTSGLDQVVLGGLAAEATVDSTLRTLNDRGFECLVLSDACAPIDHELLAHALHSTTMSGGIFGAIGDSHALITALEGNATYAS